MAKFVYEIYLEDEDCSVIDDTEEGLITEFESEEDAELYASRNLLKNYIVLWHEA